MHNQGFTQNVFGFKWWLFLKQRKVGNCERVNSFVFFFCIQMDKVNKKELTFENYIEIQ